MIVSPNITSKLMFCVASVNLVIKRVLSFKINVVCSSNLNMEFQLHIVQPKEVGQGTKKAFICRKGSYHVNGARRLTKVFEMCLNYVYMLRCFVILSIIEHY